MKSILLLPAFFCCSLFANAQSDARSQQAADNSPRTAASSVQTRTEPAPKLPYDVNDKYMGRKDEFLGILNVPDLPSDFPVYQKEWSVKDYNGVVDAYFINHIDLVKERYKAKIQYLKQRNQ